jgi:hypothetical protein
MDKSIEVNAWVYIREFWAVITLTYGQAVAVKPITARQADPRGCKWQIKTGGKPDEKVIVMIDDDRRLQAKHVNKHEVLERLDCGDGFDPDTLDVILPFLEKCLGLVAVPWPSQSPFQGGPPKMAGMSEEQIAERLGRLRARGGPKGGTP